MSYEKEIAWLLKEKYGGKKSSEFRVDIERLKQGEPAAFVIGFVDFLGLKIDLSHRPLIPRAETEWWVEQAIKEVRDGSKCLDIFAGSGCIGVSILKHLLYSTVDFADKEDKALKQIEINCKENGIDKSRYKIIKSDVFEKISGTYDYIFANPPYVAEFRISDVQKSVLDYEPHQALFSGEDGLEIIKKFLRGVKNHLSSDGVFYMEFDYRQKDEIEKILKQEGFSEYKLYQDQFKKWRYLCAWS